MSKLVLLAACIVSPMAFAQSPKLSNKVTEPGWAFAVIELQYATAEEIAPVLAAVLPPGIRVVPYPPTNSLIIVEDRTVIEHFSVAGGAHFTSDWLLCRRVRDDDTSTGGALFLNAFDDDPSMQGADFLHQPCR